MKKILLHSCCAVCMAYPAEKLISDGFEPVVYFYNPNIYPESEYQRRLNELVKYCEKIKCQYIIGEFENLKWYDSVKGLEQEPEKGKRCIKCFEFRLNRTAEAAKELGFSYFTTTLTVSPHKNSDAIFAVAKDIEQKYGLNFVYENFKKSNGFLKTMQLAKENNFYRQQYCGCEYSIRHTKTGSGIGD